MERSRLTRSVTILIVKNLRVDNYFFVISSIDHAFADLTFSYRLKQIRFIL